MLNHALIESSNFSCQEAAASWWRRTPNNDKIQMAQTYRDAFAGPPWREVGQCPKCGIFTSELGSCSKCSTQVAEAYPTKDLRNIYFPNTLRTFIPGMVAIAKTKEQIIGFTLGGFRQLDRLIKDKYPPVCSTEVLKITCDYFGLSPRLPVWYDNETCVRPGYQGLGVGARLNSARINSALELGDPDLTIIGRSINRKWLDVKQRQLSDAGLTYREFTPADTYDPARTLYVARR